MFLDEFTESATTPVEGLRQPYGVVVTRMGMGVPGWMSSVGSPALGSEQITLPPSLLVNVRSLGQRTALERR